MKTFTIVLVSGERYQVEKESKEKVLSWINTGAAGFLPIRGRDLVRITPNNVKEIIEWVDEKEETQQPATNP